MKMIGKLNEKDLKINKKQMILWMGGILAAVILLMVFIVKVEPPAEGISRAEAAKALALVFEDPQTLEDMASERENSSFTDKEKGNWFVKYMDYLYEKGYLDTEITPATLTSAQGNLTYEDVNTVAEKLSSGLEKQVGMTRGNKKKTFSRNDWWELYKAIVKETDKDGNMKEVSAVLFGTPSNMEQAESWTAYTTEGTFGFQGLALDAYLDCEIRFWARGQEMAGMTQIVSEEPVYKNIWVSDVKKDQFTVYIGKYVRTFTAEGKLASQAEEKNEELRSCVADLHMEKGKLKKITVKKERVRGKVLAVTDESIELEGYGCVPIDDNFHVYKTYGDFQVLGKGNILVGYDLQEFVAADGKLCAAVLEQPFDAETIRVLIMDNGFKQIFHDTIELTANCDGELIYEKENGENQESSFKKGDTFSYEASDKKLENGRMILKPEDSEGITVTSLERGQGQPTYSGSIEVKAEEGGLVLINELYLEDYLKKVVPSEMPASYEKEALKAQAVCARTYAYRQIQGNAYGQYGAQVDDSTNFQVYNNISTSERTDQAVNETCGQMLFYNDKPIEAFYYSTSCGHGADGSVWGNEGAALPYLRSMQIKKGARELTMEDNDTFDDYIRSKNITSYDASYPMFRWHVDIKASILSAQIPGVGNVTDVNVVSRGLGGIASEVEVKGDGGSYKIKGQSQVRSMLGNTELVIKKQDGSDMTGTAALPSAFISVEKRTAEDGSIVFRVYGGGFGHGVGMSQNGAHSMAKAGKTYKDILDFFYHGAEIRTE